MKYNNFILTLIALLLALHLMKPWLSPVKANAASGITKVDIVKVSGSRVDAFRGVLSVNIEKVDGDRVKRGIPVSIVK